MQAILPELQHAACSSMCSHPSPSVTPVYFLCTSTYRVINLGAIPKCEL